MQAEQRLRPPPPPNRIIAEDLAPLSGVDHSRIGSVSISGKHPNRLPAFSFTCEWCEVTGAQRPQSN